MVADGKKLCLLALILQIIFLVIFAAFGEYDTGAATIAINSTESGAVATESLRYAMFQDVHVMIFIGFGFLMTFLHKYGFSAVGYNLLISAMCIQWSIIIHGFIHFGDHHNKIGVNLGSLLGADFATASVLISFGAVLGKTNSVQLMVMAVIEIVLFNVNEYIGRSHLQAVDAGDSIFVHAFGAYFGLAVARVLFKKEHNGHPKEGSSYTSDLFAMVGSVFLWIYWPSFNSGGLDGTDRHRAIVNTYLALGSCCVTAFAISAAVDKHGKFNMVHVQNSTLAGGVAVGAIGNFVIQPWGAIVVGMVAAIISVLGYQYLTPFLSNRLGIHDTCGVHNLHGMPALIAGIGSAIAAAAATSDGYGKSMATVFELNSDKPEKDWTPAIQGGNQAAALAVTLVFALVGGVLTGFIMKIPIWGQQKGLFDDEEAWILEEDDEPEAKSNQQLQM